MASFFADRVKETSTTTGTGTLNLAGAETGFITFVAGIGTGNPCYYGIKHQSADEWEVGIGTVTDASPDTLSRTTILASSNAGSAVNFSAGTKDVWCNLPANQLQAIEAPIVPGGRLTLTTATPVTTSDATGTTLYYALRRDNRLSLYSGSRWKPYTFTERSITNSGLSADTNYDVFLYDNAGTLTLSLTAWTNDTTRATALTTQDGVYVKSGATDYLYLGTIRTYDNGGTVTFADTESRRFVWNLFHPEWRKLKCIETANSWAYSSTTVRASNNDTTLGQNRVSWVQGLSEKPVKLTNYQTFIRGSAASAVGALIGVGIDSTTTNSADVYGSESDTNGNAAQGKYCGYPGIGYHYGQRLEAVQGASATTTWQGDNGWSVIQSGMVGGIWA